MNSSPENLPGTAAPRKLGFPSIMHFNKINEPVEGLTEKIENLSNPVKSDGKPYEEEERSVLVQKETQAFTNNRISVYRLKDNVTEAENEMLDLENQIKTSSDNLGHIIHEINMIV
jgi:hypothetical protein